MRLELNEPSRLLVMGPRPRDPTTTRSASLDKSTRTGIAGENNISVSICAGPPAGVVDRAVSTASSRIFCPCSTCQREKAVVAVSCGSVTPMGCTAWTRVRGTLRIAASRAAQSTAHLAAGDPSTPTKTPEWVIGADIYISLLDHCG